MAGSENPIAALPCQMLPVGLSTKTLHWVCVPIEESTQRAGSCHIKTKRLTTMPPTQKTQRGVPVVFSFKLMGSALAEVCRVWTRFRADQLI